MFLVTSIFNKRFLIPIIFHRIFFFIKALVLGIIMKLDISDRLTPQVITIICHHMNKILLKKKKYKKT